MSACEKLAADSGRKLADCDQSALTYCETDTNIDPAHCGGCSHKCELCRAGDCLDAETLAATRVRPDVEVTREAVYLLIPGANARVLALKKDTGELTTVVDGLSNVRAFAVGSERVFLHDPALGRLYSAELASGSQAREEASFAEQFAVAGTTLYWVEGASTLRGKDVADGTQLTPRALGAPVQALAADEQRVVIALDGASSEYVLSEISADVQRELARAPGSVERLELRFGDVFALVREPAGTYHVARYVPGRTAVRYGARATIHSFAVDAGYVYLSWSEALQGGMDAIPLDAPGQVIATGLRQGPAALSVDDIALGSPNRRVYFTEAFPPALKSVPAAALLRPVPPAAGR